MKKRILPICCFCLVALLGITLWQGDYFSKTPSVELDDSTIIGEKDMVNDIDGSGVNNDIDGHWSPNGLEAPPSDSTNSATSENSDLGDRIGMVKYGGANYVQCSTTSKAYTPDKYLGEAEDYEGTYQNDFEDIVGGLYMTKEDPNVLMVEMKNSEYTDYVILIKEQN